MGEASSAGESISVQKSEETEADFDAAFRAGEPVQIVNTRHEYEAATGLPWHADHANLVLLVNYLESQGYGVSDIVAAVEKPWHYEDEFQAALAARDPDRKETDHG